MKDRYKVIVFSLFLALLFHLIYGRYGFNPTDEGFILAYSRRIWEGQVPHKDFISIRPVFSAIMHLPELMAGDYVFYISRLVAWAESAAIISLIWLLLGIKGKNWPLLAVALMFSTFNYPLMAWHTIDGIFLSVLGGYMLQRRNYWYGGILLGLAALCKQNFIIAGPAAFFFFSIYRERSVWLAWSAPLVIYFVIITSFGGAVQFYQQMQGETSLVQVGFLTYLSSIPFLAGLIFPFIINQAHRFLSHRAIPITGLASLLSVCLFFLFNGNFYIHPPMLLSGVLLGSLLFLKDRSGDAQACWFIFALAWTASVSIGLNSPALVAGSIFLATYKLWSTFFNLRLPTPALVAISVICMLAYHHGRANYIYRDLEQDKATVPLSTVFDGGGGIYTGPQTAALLRESDSLAKNSERPIAFVPLLPAFYVRAEHVNPLLIDWAEGIEIANADVFDQLTQHVLLARDQHTIALQKYRTSEIAFDKVPIDVNRSDKKFAKWISLNLTPFAETEFYILYK